MTRTLNAHFDGKVLIPDGSVELPVGKSLRVIVQDELSTSQNGADGVAGVKLNEWLARQRIDSADIALMTQAIDEGCGKVDVDGW